MVKGGKRSAVDKSATVREKNSSSNKRDNPFDSKFTRSKDNVLGKNTRNKVGNVLKSRKRQTEKRAELLKDFNSTRRSGLFEDTRIGEDDPTLSTNEKMFKRFAVERKKSFQSKKLNESQGEEMELSLVSQKARGRDERLYGGISEEMVSQLHFGRGGDANQKDYRDRLDQLIAESKQAKYERHADKYETSDRVDELDDAWTELKGAIFTAGAPLPVDELKKELEIQNGDSFDTAVRELRFEKRPDHNITSEMLGLDLNKKRERYNVETEAFMDVGALTKGEVKNMHISADALDEDFALLTKKEKRKITAPHVTPNIVASVIKGSKSVSDRSSSLRQTLENLRIQFNPAFDEANKPKLIKEISHTLKRLFSPGNTESSEMGYALNEFVFDALPVLFEIFKAYAMELQPAIHSVITKFIVEFSGNKTFDCATVSRCYSFLKMVSALFPVSDAYHSVTTPSFSLLGSALRYAAKNLSENPSDTDLFCLSVSLIDLGVSLVSRSRRFFPEVLICYICLLRALKVQEKNFAGSCSSSSCPFKTGTCFKSFSELLEKSLVLGESICNLWANLVGSQVFFSEIVGAMKQFKEKSSAKLKGTLESYEKCISKPLVPLKSKIRVQEAVKELPTFAPLISNELNSKVKKETAAEKTTRLKRQLKKEKRNAIRELRRDTQFLARHNLKERLVADEEREKKTKRIIGQLAMQEGEYKKLHKI